MISNSIEQKRMKYTNFILFALLHSRGICVWVRRSQFFPSKDSYVSKITEKDFLSTRFMRA